MTLVIIEGLATYVCLALNSAFLFFFFLFFVQLWQTYYIILYYIIFILYLLASLPVTSKVLKKKLGHFFAQNTTVTSLNNQNTVLTKCNFYRDEFAVFKVSLKGLQ